MAHTIAAEAQPSKPRKRGRTAVNLKGDRLVKRISGPTELPLGTTIIDAGGLYWERTEDGWWAGVTSKGRRSTDRAALSALDLKYPAVVVDMKATHQPRPNREARRAEALDDRRDARQRRRFKTRRVAEFLKAASAEERARYAAAGATPAGGAR